MPNNSLNRTLASGSRRLAQALASRMMDEGVTVRIAGPSDTAQVLAAYAAWDRRRTVAPDDVIYVLEVASELAGIVRRTFEHDVTLLRGMCIAPAKRRRGFGLRLLESFASGLNGAECYCLPYTHLVAFYNKVGFVTVPEVNIPSFLRARLVEYRGRGHSVLAMHRAPRAGASSHAG